MAFYKMVNGTLVCAANSVATPTYTLIASQAASYAYPVDGWTWYDTVAEAYAAEGVTAAGYPMTAITKLAFRNRFTQAEKVTIEIAQLDDPTASMASRQQAAALRASQNDVQAGSFIDLANPNTIAGTQALEAAGILASGRSAIILDTTTIQPSERPT